MNAGGYAIDALAPALQRRVAGRAAGAAALHSHAGAWEQEDSHNESDDRVTREDVGNDIGPMTLIAKNNMIYPGFRLPLVLLLLTTVAHGQSTKDYLTDLENKVIDEMNLARTNPSQYANTLREYKQWFDGNYLRMPGESVLVTNEGVTAVNEAIRFLERQRPLAPLSGKMGMSRGARDHVKDQGPKGALGHTGSDGSSPWDRIERYGSWQRSTAENISYGADSARRIVMQLIIDDSVPSRGHRNNIFNQKFNVTGVAVGKHSEYGRMCVITYAEEYTE